MGNIYTKVLRGLIAVITFVFLVNIPAIAQNEVAIGSATTKSNAILYLNGNGSQGLILPVVSNKTAVSSPDKGMIVFDDTDKKVWYRNDNAWVEVGGSGGTQSLNLQLNRNQLQLRDGTTTLSTVNIAGGTETNDGFMVFTGGSWQYAALSGDVSGTNGALLVDGIKGKTLPALPTTTQALVYDGTAWKFQPLTGGTFGNLTTSTPGLTITGGTGAVAGSGVTLNIQNATVSQPGLLTATDFALFNSKGNGTVTSVTGTAPISVTAGNAPVVSITQASGTTAGFLSAADYSSFSGKVSLGGDLGGTASTPVITKIQGVAVSPTAPGLNQVLQYNGFNWTPATLSLGLGTVTSVGLSLPSIFTVSNSPVNTTGTLTGSLASQSANTIFAAPDGSGGTPSFRGLVAADIPNLDVAKITGILPTTQGGTGLSFSSGSINNGQLLIGSGGAFTKANLTQGNGITITNGAGTISIATSGNFGSQNLSTSGTLNAGATTVSGLTIGTSAWPGNAPGVLTNNGSGLLSWAPSGGTGTVTSVALTMPAIFTVAGSPVTNTGTLAATLASQSAATIFAAPAAAAGVPSFRTLAATDIPNLDAGKITTGSMTIARGGTGLTTAPANGQLMIGNGTGYALSTLAAGTGVNIANGAGTITISATGLANPMTAPGDIIYGGAAGAATRLASGTGFLKGGAIPSYTAVDLATTDVSGLLPLTNGGTGSNTAAGARTSLGLGSLATLNTVSSAEIADGTIANIDILNVDAGKITTGTLAVARGGTNSIATPTNGGVSYGTGTAYAFTPAGTAGQMLQSNGAAAPTWVNPFTNPMTTQGDIIVGGAAGVANRLPSPGASRAILGYNGTIPTWVTGSPNQLLGTDGAGDLNFINQSGFLNIASTAGGDLTGTFANLQLAPLAIVNADIATLAAIEGTKVNPDFGAQNISTTGTLTISGATTLTTLGGSGSQMVVVDNDGLLGKQALPSGFSTLNIIPKGNGTTLINSQIFDDGTNVGIGTTTPAAQLHLASTVSNKKIILFGSGGNDHQFIGFGVDGTGALRYQTAATTNDHIFYSGVSAIASNELMRITGTGNVGIGTTAPTAKLDIGGNLNISTGSTYQYGGSTIISLPAGTGGDNLVIGKNPPAGLAGGQGFNVIIGQNALNAGTPTARANVAIGFNAQEKTTTAIDQVAIGVNSLVNNTTGSYNTTVGAGSLRTISTASDYNTAIGWHAGINFTSGTYNTFLGETTDAANGLTNATAIGSKAFVTQSNSIVLGSINGTNGATSNTRIGIGTTAPAASLDVVGTIKITDGSQSNGRVLTSDANGLASWQPAGAGSGWTLLGNGGTDATTNFIGTTDNIALNFRVNNQKAGVIQSDVSGQLANVGLGYNALNANTAGNNVAIGTKALQVNSTAANNTAVGRSALFSSSTGFGSNTAIGSQALYENTTGYRNTAIGYLAGSTVGADPVAGTGITSGNNNTFVGSQSGASVGSPAALTNATAIGASAKVNASNTMVFGNAVTKWGFGKNVAGANVFENSVNTAVLTNGGVWTNASDSTMKKNITNINYGLREVLQLRPVIYDMKEDNKHDIGFIAQEVKSILPEIVYGEEGQMSMSYGQITAVLTKAIQEQQQEIEELKAQLKEKNNKVNTLESSVTSMKEELEDIKRVLGIQSNLKTNGKK